jgi:hypothetical protein
MMALEHCQLCYRHNQGVFNTDPQSRLLERAAFFAAGKALRYPEPLEYRIDHSQLFFDAHAARFLGQE